MDRVSKSKIQEKYVLRDREDEKKFSDNLQIEYSNFQFQLIRARI